MMETRIFTLLLCLLFVGCDQAPKEFVIDLRPRGQVTSEEMEAIFDVSIRAFPEFSEGTIIYEDMRGIRVGSVASRGDMDELTLSLAQMISSRGYGPVGTSWHQGEPDTTNLPAKEKRFVQVQDLTQRGRNEGYDKRELAKSLKHVNWAGGDLMSDEDIGNIVVGSGNLKNYAVLVFSSRKPYTITIGEQGSTGQPTTRPESK
jgi:hypothetical protein